MTKMNREQMLEYIKPFDKKKYSKDAKDEVVATVKKIEALMEKFGFKYYRSFNSLQNLSNREDTSWYYRFEIGEYEFIEVQVGWVYITKTYGRGRNSKSHVIGIDGMCRISHRKISLNPRTGKPWQIGDIDYSNPNNPAQLTKHGWWTGD
jgi:hypothetical protein